MKTEPEVGKVYAIRYPFFLSSYSHYEDEGPVEVESWCPGCQTDDNITGDDYFPEKFYYSEGHGEMLLEVVAEFKPGRFPTRVFYVRKWKDPNGKVFGLPKLRMTTKTNFMNLLKGYRHPYIDDDSEAV